MSIIKEKAEKVVGFLARRWACEGGYRSVLSIAVPLILSTGAWSILHFVDRMFLTWYSPEAIAAAMPAGMLNFTIMSLFLGTAGYVTTFVAQYHGSGQHQRIGPVLWQGIYIAVAGGILHLLLIPLAGPIFRFVGHEPLVQEYEIIYFQVLCLGATPAIASSAISGFFYRKGQSLAGHVGKRSGNCPEHHHGLRIDIRKMGTTGARNERSSYSNGTLGMLFFYHLPCLDFAFYP